MILTIDGIIVFNFLSKKTNTLHKSPLVREREREGQDRTGRPSHKGPTATRNVIVCIAYLHTMESQFLIQSNGGMIVGDDMQIQDPTFRIVFDQLFALLDQPTSQSFVPICRYDPQCHNVKGLFGVLVMAMMMMVMMMIMMMWK